MPVLTLAELRERALGTDYVNSTVFTSAVVNRFINEAMAELYEIVSSQHEGHFDTTATVVTAAGVQTVNLPSDFYDLRALDRQIDTAGEQHVPLRRINLMQTYGLQGRGKPQGYMLHGGTAPGTVRLWPIPDGVYTLRVTYEPLFDQLEDDTDSFDFRNGWEDLVIQSARMRMAAEEERPFDATILERAQQRIVTSANKRNSAEPDYLTLHVDYTEEEVL